MKFYFLLFIHLPALPSPASALLSRRHAQMGPRASAWVSAPTPPPPWAAAGRRHLLLHGDSLSSPSHCMSAPKRPSLHPPGRAGGKRAWGTGPGGEACPQGPGHCHHPEPGGGGTQEIRDVELTARWRPHPPPPYPPPASSTLSTQHPHPSLLPPVLDLWSGSRLAPAWVRELLRWRGGGPGRTTRRGAFGLF